VIAAIVVTLAAIAAGFAGFKLVPDTDLYARHGLHLWPSPLGSLAGAIAGLPGLIYVSALAAGLLVLLVPRRRWRFAALAGYWLMFPGVDALGAVFVLLMLRSRRRGWPSWSLAALAHPVAALTSWPLLWRRDRLGVALVAVMTIAAIVGVGLYDGWTTTDRYALPLLGVACSPRGAAE
jgi:hypothetical protein